jgi:hypothetical protein
MFAITESLVLATGHIEVQVTEQSLQADFCDTHAHAPHWLKLFEGLVDGQL